jgi:hypothetical protein
MHRPSPKPAVPANRSKIRGAFLAVIALALACFALAAGPGPGKA